MLFYFLYPVYASGVAVCSYNSDMGITQRIDEAHYTPSELECGDVKAFA